MQSISVLVVLVLAFSYALASDDILDQRWKGWKIIHDKQYSNAEEQFR